jgi:hypothetical protein
MGCHFLGTDENDKTSWKRHLFICYILGDYSLLVIQEVLAHLNLWRSLKIENKTCHLSCGKCARERSSLRPLSLPVPPPYQKVHTLRLTLRAQCAIATPSWAASIPSPQREPWQLYVSSPALGRKTGEPLMRALHVAKPPFMLHAAGCRSTRSSPIER